MTKTVASIYFSALQEVRRPSYQGYFSVPVVKRGEKPFLLTIKDHFEYNDMPFFAGTTANGKPFKQKITILGEDIAQDVIKSWTKDGPEMTPFCAPGMWMVRDVVPLFDDEGKPLLNADGAQESRPATKEEREAMFTEDLAAAMDRQNAWAEISTLKGDVMADDPKKIPWIPQYCRDSVDYLSRERSWRKGLRDGDVKSCPSCTKSISSKAVKCPFCAEIVDPVGYANFKADHEEAVRDANARIKTQREAKNLRTENERLRAEKEAKQLATA